MTYNTRVKLCSWFQPPLITHHAVLLLIQLYPGNIYHRFSRLVTKHPSKKSPSGSSKLWDREQKAATQKTETAPDCECTQCDLFQLPMTWVKDKPISAAWINRSLHNLHKCTHPAVDAQWCIKCCLLRLPCPTLLHKYWVEFPKFVSTPIVVPISWARYNSNRNCVVLTIDQAWFDLMTWHSERRVRALLASHGCIHRPLYKNIQVGKAHAYVRPWCLVLLASNCLLAFVWCKLYPGKLEGMDQTWWSLVS